MLHAENLACLRGERVVFAGLDLILARGEALLLTGANGAGKSSLLRLLAGLLAAAEGRVLWDGAAEPPPLRYLGHADALKPAFTAAENLGFAAKLAGIAESRVAPALAAMDLAPLAALPARVLSAGQKRRLALARLALDTPGSVPLWLLDEPATGLDAASIERLGALFATHRAAGGMIVAATHQALPLPGAREFRL